MPLNHFYAKWVDSFDTTFDSSRHALNEVGVFDFSLSQAENGFALLTLTARNPQVGLVNPDRRQWLWFSWQSGSSTVTPLFFGRILAVPQDIVGVKTTLMFRARPRGYRSVKEALAETLKVAPYWDPVFVPAEALNDPDAVLIARTAHWHVDRVTHAATISDKYVGEDGTLTYTQDDILGISGPTHNGAVASRCKVRAEMRYVQSATGTLDVTQSILDAFANPAVGNGGNPHMIASYTGGALVAGWPLPGDNIGGGWSVADATIQSGYGTWIGLEERLSQVRPIYTQQRPFFSIDPTPPVERVRCEFNLWSLKPYLVLRYEAARNRTEIVEFELIADVQSLIVDDDDAADPIEISLASNALSEAVDGGDNTAGPTTPIEDARRICYVVTDRGHESVEHLIARARAALLDAARSITIKITLPFRELPNITLRKSIALEHDMIPGGLATGKIIAYNATGSGEGRFLVEVTLACAAGRGASVAAATGVPDYVEDGYVEPGYQTYSNQYTLLSAGDVTYLDYVSSLAIDDDGIDFFDMRRQDILNYVLVTNGPAAQYARTNDIYDSVDAAIAAMEEVKTEICLSPKRLTRGPFETRLALTVSELMVPNQINLEAAAA